MTSKVTIQDTEKIKKLYESGLSSRQIAKLFGRSSSGIRVILNKTNIEMRTMSYANKISASVKRGSKHFNWAGGKTFHKGQMYINIQHTRVKESHYIWCKANNMISVPLGCVIHHIDGNPKNNDADNLILLDQSYHVKLHKKLEDVKFQRYLKCNGI